MVYIMVLLYAGTMVVAAGSSSAPFNQIPSSALYWSKADCEIAKKSAFLNPPLEYQCVPVMIGVDASASAKDPSR
jgi:hypothetical protein